MSRRTYGDWLYADSGLSFAEYMGIEVPRVDYDTGRDGKSLYRFSRFSSWRGESIYGEWRPTKQDAKASYKAELKKRREREREWSSAASQTPAAQAATQQEAKGERDA